MLVAQISDIHAGPDLSSLRTLERAIGWLKTSARMCLLSPEIW
ncbi:hypothetical protein ACQY74_007043 (plasmid) [Rhizobium leguminosarum bv. trifolii]